MRHPTWTLPVPGGHIGGVCRDGDGPDVVLVPSFGFSALSWSAVMEHLEGVRSVALDLRGHARSLDAPLVNGGDSWRDIVRVIEGLQLDRPVVVGHNVGGFMALAAAADRPDLISAVVAVEAGLSDAPREEVHRDLQMTYTDAVIDTLAARFGWGQVFSSQQEVDAVVASSRADTARDWLLSAVPRDFDEEIRYVVVERPDGTWLRTPDRAAVRIACTIDPDARYYPDASLYEQIEVPLHLVQADDGMGRIDPEQLERLRAGRPNVVVHTLEGGYLVQYTHPEALADVVRNALTTAAPSTVTPPDKVPSSSVA